MRAGIEIEAIGDNYIWMAKHERESSASPIRLKEEINIIRYGRRELWPWVAKLLSLDDRYGFAREFVRGYTDYSRASGEGIYGIYIYYALEDGIYEVNKSIRLGVPKRYFIRVQDATITEITREEAIQCLTKTSDTSE
jgi:hypothetical protein